MKSILDRSFKYVDSAHTNIRRTFARVRAEQRKREEQQPAAVTPITKSTKRR